MSIPCGLPGLKSEDEPCVVADVIGQYVVCSCNKHCLQLMLVECLTVR